MARYVWHAGEWLDVASLPKAEPVGPYLQSDYPAYRSPLGTGWVDGRTARREEMKRHDCVPFERQGNYRGGIRNPDFAKRRGIDLTDAPLPLAKRIEG